MAIVWLGASLMLCGWRGGPGMLGFATVVMLIFGGCPKTFVRRTSAVYCRARPPGWGGCSGDGSRSCCARAGRLGAASPAARKVSNGRCQRELVILRRVVFVCFGGSGVLCVRGSPAGMDVGGTGSGVRRDKPAWRSCEHERRRWIGVDGGSADCGAVGVMEVGWPSGVALRGEASNRPQLHWLKTVVVNVVGKGAARSRQVRVGKMSDGREPSAVDVSKPVDDVETRVASSSWDEPGGYPFTAQAASGIQAA